MMVWARFGLLLVSLIAFAAAGAALAALRAHRLREGGFDWSLLSVAAALVAIGALCTAAATGLLGILAFGGVCVWASYMVTAQRMGLFRVRSALTTEERTLEEHHPRT